MTQTLRVAAALLVLLAACSSLSAQSSGKRPGLNAYLGLWGGIAKGEGVPDLRFDMELKTEGKKVVGKILSRQANYDLSDGRLVAGKLQMTIKSPQGESGKMVATVKDGHLIGQWSLGPKSTGTFDCIRPPGGANK